jgi:chromosomal replication initiation ATPase DnaA
MTDLSTHALQVAHYRAVKARLHGPRAAKATPIAPKPEKPLTTPPKPYKSLRQTILTLISTSQPRDAPIQMEDLIRIVIKVTGIPKVELLSNRRQKPICEARQLFYWLARKYTIASLPSIGRRCGLKDHSTIAHGVKKIDQSLKEFGRDSKWQARIDACLVEMGG